MAALPPEVTKLITKIKVFKSGISEEAKENKNAMEVFKLTVKLQSNLEKVKQAEKDIADLRKIKNDMKVAKIKLPKESQNKHKDFFESVEKFNVDQLKEKK